MILDLFCKDTTKTVKTEKRFSLILGSIFIRLQSLRNFLLSKPLSAFKMLFSTLISQIFNDSIVAENSGIENIFGIDIFCIFATYFFTNFVRKNTNFTILVIEN